VHLAGCWTRAPLLQTTQDGAVAAAAFAISRPIQGDRNGIAWTIARDREQACDWDQERWGDPRGRSVGRPTVRLTLVAARARD
jgi:hypothetical protein